MYNPSPVAAKTSANKMPALEAAVLFDVAKGDLIAKARHLSKTNVTGMTSRKGTAGHKSISRNRALASES